MAGPWWLTFWVVYDEEMFGLGDPQSFTERTIALNWETTTSEIDQYIENLF